MSMEDLACPPTAAELLERLQAPGRLLQGGDQTRPNQPQPLDFPEDWGGAQRTTSEPEKINIHARNVLGLDLGTHTGWAIRRRDGTIRHGTESFVPRKSWGPGQKWKRYRSWLLELLNTEQIHAVTYELVIRHEVKGKALWDSAHAYGAFQAYTFEACESFNIVPEGVNLATVKKHWTGKGNADKTSMLAEAMRRGFRPVDDNAADALAILHFALQQEDS